RVRSPIHAPQGWRAAAPARCDTWRWIRPAARWADIRREEPTAAAARDANVRGRIPAEAAARLWNVPKIAPKSAPKTVPIVQNLSARTDAAPAPAKVRLIPLAAWIAAQVQALR